MMAIELVGRPRLECIRRFRLGVHTLVRLSQVVRLSVGGMAPTTKLQQQKLGRIRRFRRGILTPVRLNQINRLFVGGGIVSGKLLNKWFFLCHILKLPLAGSTAVQFNQAPLKLNVGETATTTKLQLRQDSIKRLRLGRNIAALSRNQVVQLFVGAMTVHTN